MADLDTTNWSETDGSNTQAPPAGWPAGMLPNQVEPTAQAMMGAIKRFWNRINGIYTSTGAAGVYGVTPAAAFPVAYVDGERFVFKAHQASRGLAAGGDTLNWNTLGAKKLFKPTTGGFAQIDANDIVLGQRVDVIYDSTLDSSAGGFAVMGPPIASITAPTGGSIIYHGFTAPGGWLFANGTAISRATYAALFSAIAISTTGTFTSGSKVVTGIASTSGMSIGMPMSGTNVVLGAKIQTVDSATQITMDTNASGNGAAAFVVAPFGVGDGSTTFNVPDLRGRVPAGTDNMNGVGAAGRLGTGATGGVTTAATLGATGGEQSHTLITGELAAHSHGVNDPTHQHTINGGNSYVVLDPAGGSGLIAGPNVTTVANNTPAATGISIQNTGSGTAHNVVQPTLVVNYIIKT